MYYPFSAIRDHYTHLTPLIFDRSYKHLSGWVNPYSDIDWTTMFSPIEMQTWYVLRGFGKCPMYPQYPVGNYFVDFGNPFTKVAVECDGKQWHENRKEQDKIRDHNLKDMGWDVFRISGSDCYRVSQEFETIMSNGHHSEYDTNSCIEEYYTTTIEGLIKAVAMFYFGYRYVRDDYEFDMAFRCLKDRISIDNPNIELVYNSIERFNHKF